MWHAPCFMLWSNFWIFFLKRNSLDMGVSFIYIYIRLLEFIYFDYNLNFFFSTRFFIFCKFFVQKKCKTPRSFLGHLTLIDIINIWWCFGTMANQWYKLVWTSCLMHRCVCIWWYILQNYNYKLMKTIILLLNLILTCQKNLNQKLKHPIRIFKLY